MTERLKINVRERRVIRGDQWVRLTRTEFVIFAAIYYHGELPTSELMDICYGNDPSGGPDMGVRALDVFIRHTNNKLQKLGAGISSFRQHFRMLRDEARIANRNGERRGRPLNVDRFA